MNEQGTDMWARWLRGHRFRGGDRELRTQADLDAVKEELLERAAIESGDTVLDVGAGDGLVGLDALERVGPTGRVLFCDISSALLTDAKRSAKDAGHGDRAAFIEANAEDLSTVPDDSIDVVTMRSVLVYIAEKETALDEIERVLKPGGRLSLFEPLPAAIPVERADTFLGYAVDDIEEPIPDEVRSLPGKIEGYRTDEREQDASTLAMDDRDLFGLAASAGFSDIRIEVSRWDTRAAETEEWDAWLDSSYAPGVPTKREAIEAALTPAEQAAFVEFVKPLVEGETIAYDRGATAALWAVKPPDRSQ